MKWDPEARAYWRSEVADRLLSLLSRKFLLSGIVLTISTVALWTGRLSGENFVWVVSLVCGMFSLANALSNRLNRGGE